jgi:cell division protein ZapA (FtsZ GTPase activity inhibitor)
MTGPITETTVTIRGVDYQLRGDAAPQHMAALAAHVDEKMRLLEEAARGMTQTPARLAILASLMIADELFQERGLGQEFENRPPPVAPDHDLRPP